MTQSEFATAIREGYDLLEALEDWERSACTFISDSPLSDPSNERVAGALMDYASFVGKELSIAIGACVQGLLDSRST